MRLSFPEHHLFQILKRFDNQHLPLDLFMSHYFRAHKALGSKDRRFISTAAYGMTRWRSLLDYLIADNLSWERRYAIYKAFQPNNYLYVNSIPLSTRLSFPEELFELLRAQYGEQKAIHLCQISNTEAPVTIRVNPLKTTRAQLLTSFSQKYEASPCDYSPLGIQFKQRLPFSEMEAFKNGLFEIQDEGSQLIANLVQAKPGDQILDFCAGTGGKALAFAPAMEGRGQIYLHDIRPYALERGRKRFKRAGIQMVQFLSPDHPHLLRLKKRMDWVLVDAPCSGTGTTRRNPDMKWKFSTKLLETLIEKQRTIFEHALRFLRPGGKIVYATCSLLKQENEEQLHHFLKTYPLRMVESPFCTLPTFNGMDGFFAAVLESELLA